MKKHVSILILALLTSLVNLSGQRIYLNYPAPNSNVSDTAPVFKWTGIGQGTINYTLYIDDDNTPLDGNSYFTNNVDSLVLDNYLVKGQSYSWAVRISSQNDTTYSKISYFNLVSSNHDGVFQKSTSTFSVNSLPTKMIYQDLNNDTYLDGIVAMQDAHKVLVFYGDSLGYNSSFKIENNIGPVDFELEDINKDGLIDLIVASKLDGKISWYENKSNQTFEENIITRNAKGVKRIECDDINGDGRVDIVAGVESTNEVLIIQGEDRLLFSVERRNLNSSGLTSVSTGDIDSDGDVDIMVSTYFDGEVFWFENENGFSEVPNLVSFSFDYIRQTDLADIDKDNDLDIVGYGNNDHLIWLENDGSGIFDTSHQIGSLIHTTVVDNFHKIDINGDSYPDFLCKGSAGVLGYTELKVHKNNQDGTFSTQKLSIYNPNRSDYSFVDYNSDGDIDIVSPIIENEKLEICFYENQLKEDPVLVLDTIIKKTDQSAVAKVRIDNLGFPNPKLIGLCWDTINATSVLNLNDDTVAYSGIDSLGIYHLKMRHLIPDEGYKVKLYATGSNDDVFYFNDKTFFTDIQGLRVGLIIPKNNDRILNTTPTLTWKSLGASVSNYELYFSANPDVFNDSPINMGTDTSYSFNNELKIGNTYYWAIKAKSSADTLETVVNSFHVLDSLSLGIFSEGEIISSLQTEKIISGSVNQDTLKDLLIDNDNSIKYLENQGFDNYKYKYIHPQSSLAEFTVSDIDNDRYNDIVINDRNYLFYNDGDGVFKRNYFKGLRDLTRIKITDINNDGFNDIIGVDYWNFYVSLNGGDKRFKDYYINQSAYDYSIEDIDEDGDLDFICAAHSEVFWLENIGEIKERNFPKHILVSGMDKVTRIATSDYDGDGDLDFVCYDENEKNLYAFENDGNMSFSGEVIFTDVNYMEKLESHDFNGDRLDEIIFRKQYSDEIVLLNNEGNLNFHSASTMNVLGLYEFIVDDMDNNGTLDLVIAAEEGVSIRKNLKRYNEDNTLDSINNIGSKLAIAHATIRNPGTPNPFLDHGICWNTSGEPTIDDFKKSVGEIDGLGPIELPLSDLSPNTTYYVRFFYSTYASDFYSNEISITTTSQGIPKPSINLLNPSAYATTDKQPLFKWSGDGLGDLEYNLYIAKDNNPFLETPVYTGTETSYELASPLTEFGEYYWGVKIKDDNDSLYSIVSKFNLVKETVDYHSNRKFINNKLASIDDDEIGAILSCDFNKDNVFEFVATTNTGEELILFSTDDIQPIIIGQDIPVINIIKAADIDNDKDIDLILASNNENKIFSYENLGEYKFKQNIITDFSGNLEDIEFIDMEGDGDQDLLVAFYDESKISCFKNYKGTYYETVISEPFYGVNDLSIGDVDNDGDIDFIASSDYGNTITLFKHGAFDTYLSQVISEELDNINQVELVDFNRDGTLDILYGPITDTLKWFKNDGFGTFIDTTEIHDGLSLNSFVINDFNGDFNWDFISFSRSNDSLFYFESFSDNTYNKSLIVIDTYESENPIIRDFNSDGFMDLGLIDRSQTEFMLFQNKQDYALSLNSPRNQERLLDTTIYFDWETNLTDSSRVLFIGSLPNPQKTGNVINLDLADEFIYHHSLEPGKYYWTIGVLADNDTICATPRSFHIYNRGEGGKFEHHTEFHTGYSEYFFADFNQDKYVDIGTRNPKYINNKNRGFVKQMSSGSGMFEDILSVYDYDHDGDLDFIKSIDGGLYWLENNSDEYQKQLIYEDTSEIGVDVQFVDINKDGFEDILTIRYKFQEYNGLLILKNMGSGQYIPQFISLPYDNSNGLVQIIPDDLDKDGDLDIVLNNRSTLAWLKNEGQNFEYYEIANSNAWFGNIVVTELNQNNNTDLLVGNILQGPLRWYELIDGQFNLVENILDGVNGEFIGSADFDGDNDIDLVANTYGELCWYENDSKGDFFKHTITENALIRHIADYDLDGDFDLFLQREDDIYSYSWWENTEPMEFRWTKPFHNRATGMPVEVAWHSNYEKSIDQRLFISEEQNNFQTMDYINVADSSFLINQNLEAGKTYYLGMEVSDDYRDIRSLRRIMTIIESNQGGFIETQNVITSSLDSVESLYTADIDGDHDIDVLATSKHLNMVIWFENYGSGSFGPRVVNTEETNVNNAIVYDMDNDDDMDFLTFSSQEGAISAYFNDGNQNFSREVIQNNLEKITDLTIEDINGDSKYEILVVSSVDSSLTLYYYEGSNYNEFLIDSNLVNPTSIEAANLNNDNNVDLIVGTVEGEVMLYTNNGSVYFDKTNIFSAAHGISDLNTFDLNKDGFIDITLSLDSNGIVYQKNLGLLNFESYVIDSATNSSLHYISNLNGDEYFDIISISKSSNSVDWYYNNGASFSEMVTISNNSPQPTDIETADIDNDGDMDVFLSTKDDATISWYENLDPTYPEVTTSAIESVSANHAMIIGVIDELGNPNPTQHGFCWSLNEDPSIDNNIVELGAVGQEGSFNSEISGLLEDTIYYVRAYAQNVAGVAYGNVMSFNTQKIINIGGSFEVNNKVYDGNVSANISANSLYLNGVSVGDVIQLDSLTVQFESNNVGNDIPVIITNAYLSGSDTSDYFLDLTVSPSTIADIIPKELEIDGSFAVEDKEYDNNTIATITENNLFLIGIVGQDSVVLTAIEANFAQAEIGEDITVSLTSANLYGPESYNYELSLANAPTTTANILPASYNLIVNVASSSGPVVDAEVSIDDESLNTNSQGIVQFSLISGTYILGVTEAQHHPYSDTINIIDSDTTLSIHMTPIGITKLSTNDIIVYPNPFNNFVVLKSNKGIKKVLLISANGKKYYRELKNNMIKTTGLEQGVYILIVTDNQNSISRFKIVK